MQVEGLGQAEAESGGSTAGQNPAAAGISLSAAAAQQGWQAVQTFVALTQIQQVCLVSCLLVLMHCTICFSCVANGPTISL